MNFGFTRVAAGIPVVHVANCEVNAINIIELIKDAYKKNVQIIVFPELSITGYTCGDLFFQQVMLNSALAALKKILDQTKNMPIISIIGLPLNIDNKIFNCAVVIKSGDILGIVPKSYIPDYGEFYEKRWFSSANLANNDYIEIFEKEVPFGTDLIFSDRTDSKISFGVEICEDLWAPIPPCTYQTISGASIVFNLSASNEVIGKCEYRRALVEQQSARCFCGYVYAAAGVGESTTDLVFGGHAIIGEVGTILKQTKRFSLKEELIISDIDVQRINNNRLKNTTYREFRELKKFRKISFDIRRVELSDLEREIEKNPFVPNQKLMLSERCSEIFSIQTMGLVKRILHTGLKRVVIGVSGGLDSTLALLVVVKAFDQLNISRKNITAITMPGFGTSGKTNKNANDLMKSLGVEIIEIDIRESCLLHFKDIGHDKNIYDTTYENVQARERTQILMDIANKIGGLVIGTGDLSELALGWCTYNGDHMSMYAVNVGIPKTLVKFLVKWVAQSESDEKTSEILKEIINTPISPELLPTDKNNEILQKTENIIGPYELHDFFLYHFIKYGAEPLKIYFLAKIAFKDTQYTHEEIKSCLKIFLRRFFTQQFKRSCIPDGPKVGTISLSPRGDWRMPSDAEYKLWLDDLDKN